MVMISQKQKSSFLFCPPSEKEETQLKIHYKLLVLFTREANFRAANEHRITFFKSRQSNFLPLSKLRILVMYLWQVMGRERMEQDREGGRKKEGKGWG